MRRKSHSTPKKANTTIKNYKNMKVLLENKLELSGLIKIFKKFLEEILHTKKCDLYKSGFHVLGRQENPCEFP